MNHLTVEEIERRLPVWLAIADLFLDTDVMGIIGAARMAQPLRESGYSLDELDRILANEVAPALGFNLLDVAGEWAGWDPEWLQERILDIMTRRPLLERGIGAAARAMIADDWATVRAAI